MDIVERRKRETWEKILRSSFFLQVETVLLIFPSRAELGTFPCLPKLKSLLVCAHLAWDLLLTPDKLPKLENLQAVNPFNDNIKKLSQQLKSLTLDMSALDTHLRYFVKISFPKLKHLRIKRDWSVVDQATINTLQSVVECIPSLEILEYQSRVYKDINEESTKNIQTGIVSENPKFVFRLIGLTEDRNFNKCK